MIPRFILAAVIGGGVTFGLFFLMQALITTDARPGEEGGRKVIEFVRLKREETIQEKKREIPDKTPPEQPPPPPPMSLTQNDKPNSDSMGFGDSFSFEADLGDGPSLTTGAGGNSDAIPLVRVEPTYPIRAAERGIEGWVIVEFTISPRGTVVDPRVLASEPSTIFNSAALRAVKKWRYNPKLVDGRPVARKGIKQKLTFQLSKSQG